MSPLENLHERNLYYILYVISKELDSNNLGSRSFLPDRLFSFNTKDHRSINSPTWPECRTVFKYLENSKLLNIVSCENSKGNNCTLSKASIIHFNIPIRSAIYSLKQDLEKKIKKYNVCKEYLSDRVRVSLAFSGGIIYVCFENHEFELNSKSPLRWDSSPYNFFNEILPKYGDNEITRSSIEQIKTSRNFLQMINKAGIKGQIRKYFFPIASSGYVRFKNPVYIPVSFADKMYKYLEKVENNI